MRLLQFARKLALQNNMEFQAKYKEYFDRFVDKKDFPPGCLVWLHLPNRNTTNPKICSPFFGPFVVLEQVGDTNCVIQHLANKKTKFVNINNLRRYDFSNSHFLKKNAVASDGPDIQDKEDKGDEHKGRQSPPPPPAEFDSAGDIVILNPLDPPPRPIPLLKDEPAAVDTSQAPTVSEDGGGPDVVIPHLGGADSHSDIAADHGTPSTSSSSSHVPGTSSSPISRAISHNWPSPADARDFVARLGKKGVSDGAKIKPRILPRENTGRISRSTAQAAGYAPASLKDAERNLKIANKKK